MLVGRIHFRPLNDLGDFRREVLDRVHRSKARRRGYDGPVQVACPGPGLIVRLIHTQGRADRLRPAIPPLFAFRSVPMDPAHDRRVGDVHTPLSHQGYEIAIAQAVG